MRVNEIFYSLQGEGFFTGTPSIFIRFSGCNLKCPFCDTDHSQYTEMSPQEIAKASSAYPATHVVLTGGEPSLQVTEELIELLHAEGKFVAIETNGTHPIPDNIDWITFSPKDAYVQSEAAVPFIKAANEIKLVFNGKSVKDYHTVRVQHRFMQPCDTGNEALNNTIIKGAIDYCMTHPQWRLSLQTHKIIHIR